jgi:hypothetical protein
LFASFHKLHFQKRESKTKYKNYSKSIFFKTKHEQTSGLSAVVPFVPFGCSSRSCLPPFHRHFTAQKNKAVQPKAGQPHFSAVRSSSSHVLFPSFVRAYASTIQLHFVTVILSLNAPFHSAKSSLIRFTAFQPYYVCRPQCFQRLLFRTAIGVGSTPLLLRSPFLEALHFD